MRNAGQLYEKMVILLKKIREEAPLIHCITNPISIHDCANVVLAAGGRPIMAEHPREVGEITAEAGALALNLGNITDARRESILIAGCEAMKRNIPVVLDMVGIGCSTFRRDILAEFLEQRLPGTVLVLKGNMSELKVLAGVRQQVSGVDVSLEDAVSKTNEAAAARLVKELAQQYQAVILGSGKTDIICDGADTLLVDNGTAMMQHITGTGCMLNVLTGTYLAGADAVTAAAAAAAVFGISGELAAEQASGPGSFQPALLDMLYEVEEEQIFEMMKVRIL